MIIRCEKCGTEVQAKRSTKQFCDACLKARSKEGPRDRTALRCIDCGRELNAQRITKKYCERCYAIHRKKYKKEWSAQNPDYMKEYRETNKEEIRAWKSRYNEEHKDHNIAYTKKWRQEHRERYASYVKRYRRDNTESIAANKREWRANNKERVKLHKKRDYERHKDYILKRAKQWASENRDKIAATHRRFAKRHPDRILANVHKRRARKLNAEGHYTAAYIRSLFITQEGLCFYCKKPFFNNTLAPDVHIDHKTPLVRGGTNYPDNIVLACSNCNLRKNRSTAEEFLKKIQGV